MCFILVIVGLMGGKFRRSSNEFRFAFVNLDLLDFHLDKFVRLTKKKKISASKSCMINSVAITGCSN